MSNNLLKIKLPHWYIKTGTKKIGKFNVSYPTGLGVRWYKQGGIFNQPSVIGVGEAGPEAVLPIDKLQTMLDASNADQIRIMAQMLQLQADMLQELRKEKNFKVDGIWAGRYVNNLVRG